jgi:hypothetical protein
MLRPWLCSRSAWAPVSTDKKFERHFRVPPPVLSTGFNVWIPPRVGSDASPSAPRGSLGALASAVGVTGSDRADAPVPLKKSQAWVEWSETVVILSLAVPWRRTAPRVPGEDLHASERAVGDLG